MASWRAQVQLRGRSSCSACRSRSPRKDPGRVWAEEGRLRTSLLGPCDTVIYKNIYMHLVFIPVSDSASQTLRRAERCCNKPLSTTKNPC